MFDRSPLLPSISDLRDLAQARWHDPEALEAIARDLARRTGGSAGLLLATIRARLRDLPAVAPEVARLARELEEERHRARRAEAEAKGLRDDLAAKRSARLARDEEDLPRRPPAAGGPDAAYAELHLAPDIPDDLLEILRRVYCKHFHPDGAAGRSGRFQAVQRAFDAIRAARGGP